MPITQKLKVRLTASDGKKGAQIDGKNAIILFSARKSHYMNGPNLYDKLSHDVREGGSMGEVMHLLGSD